MMFCQAFCQMKKYNIFFIYSFYFVLFKLIILEIKINKQNN